MKKKLLTLGLSSTLALSSVMPAFANSISPSDDKTYIETAIGFKYPETISSLTSKNLKATLTGPVNLSIDLNDFLQNSNHSANIDGYNVTSESTVENDKVTVLKFKIEGLVAKDGYSLQIQGKNYVSTVVNLSTANYSKRVNISTAINMVLGDVNKDNKVDASDRKLLEDNLNADNTEYDLNNDGKITVSDIAIINSNMITTTPVETFDTEVVASKVVSNINTDKFNNITQEQTNNIEEIEGNLENLFNNEGKVSFKAKEAENNISIPLEFNTPQEMSSLEVKIPQGASNAQVILYDENDNIINTSEETPAIARFAREVENEEKTVVINLGSRRPVKKITINVVPNKNNEYVVVEEVKIIGDIVNEDVVQDTIVKNLKADAGNEEVTLSWRAVPNVTGYKVYYGKSADNLDTVLTTDVTNIKISDLKNLQTYYFSVSATSGTWEGIKSPIVSAIPEPEQTPDRPDFVNATASDGIISLNWKKAKNAKTYNVYTKTQQDSTPKKVQSGITDTNYKLTGLTNDVEYTVYVTSENSIGESNFSEPVQATPKRDEIVIPTLPTKDKISNDNILSVEIKNEDFVDNTLYPNGFDPKSLVDEDFYTSWVARSYQDVNEFTFTFKEPKTMDYLIWVPKLNGSYRNANLGYTIKVWTNDTNGEGTVIADNAPITERFENNSYYAFTFPKTENIKKMSVQLHENPGNTRVNASEVVFYDYNNLPDRIATIFANGSRTKLASGVDKQKIDDLRAEVNTTEGFVVDKNILLKELDIAQSLLDDNTEHLGFIKENVFSINPSEDTTKFSKSINDWQPLGIVGLANQKVTIYADIPNGETVSLVPTQFFEQANSLSSTPIPLKNGRNIITIPKIGNVNTDRGGSLYITYSGKNPSNVKLQVIGGNKIPYLELKDLYTITQEEAKKRIDVFIKDLTNYSSTDKLKGDLKINPLNHTEISLPNILLSLPATKVLEGINKDTTADTDKVEKMYKNVQAWEELLDVTYKTHGIDDHKNDSLQTRNNIRYMKMFAGAFMYAAGNHIGVPYESAYGLMNGKPVADLNGQTQNNLFGWGIAHEIGHVMDKLGKAEITNNIYSLMAQTYDGKENTLQSRLELSNVYEKAFKKVSDGKEGLPNDAFTHLAMYWQLHLAYDTKDKPFYFYNELHKQFKDTPLKDMNQFAMAASKVADKNLTEFFTRWGVVLSDEAKSEMAKYQTEDRAIYYLSDQSRREMLKGTQGNKNVTVEATAKLKKAENSQNDKAKEVVITITNKDDSLQGYEILRKGSSDQNFKPIGFTKTGTYTDYIGSANNLTFTYAVRPIDILGNPSPTKTLEQVRISYDNTIEKSLYSIENNIVTFNEPTIVTGIKVTPKKPSTTLPTGDYKVFADIVDNISPASTNDANEGFVLAKSGNFSNNFSTEPNTYINYFNKPNSSEDKIWAYDVNRLKLENFDFNKYNVEFLSYPGDNVEFMNMGIGRLSADYKYGENASDVIPKDSLVIVGKYRGNSVLSNVYIKGMYSTENSLNEQDKIEERPVGGYTLMFDTLDKDGTITSSTAEGIFIFVPQIQGESEDKGHESISDLPVEIMAEMWQGKFNDDGSFTKERLTSDTPWISMPTDESLPTIVLEGGQNNLKVDFK